MASLHLQPRYGPTLPQLIAARLARLSPASQLAVRVMSAMFVLALVAGAILWPRAHGFSHTGAVDFDLKYARALHRVPAGPGAYLKLQQTRNGLLVQSFEADALTLPPYDGDPVGELPVYATGYIRTLSGRFQGFRLLGEGKTRVNGQSGYTIVYSGRLGGRPITARDDLFVSDKPGRRDGVAIEMIETPAAHIGGPTLIGLNGPVGDTLQSLSLNR